MLLHNPFVLDVNFSLALFFPPTVSNDTGMRKYSRFWKHVGQHLCHVGGSESVVRFGYVATRQVLWTRLAAGFLVVVSGEVGDIKSVISLILAQGAKSSGASRSSGSNQVWRFHNSIYDPPRLHRFVDGDNGLCSLWDVFVRNSVCWACFLAAFCPCRSQRGFA